MGRSDALLQDLKLALRLIQRKPAFAALVIFLLALGSGSAAAVFSLVQSALLRPLPYRDPSQLVLVNRSDDEQTGSGFSLELLHRVRRSTPALGSLAGFQYESFIAIFDSEPERIPGMLVTPNLFTTLGVQPAMGPGFSANNDRQVIISYAFWKRRPGILGKSLQLNDGAYSVVGVMPPWFHFDRGEGLPPGFDFSRSVDLWIPAPASVAARGNILLAIARIPNNAQAILNVTAHNLHSPRGLHLTAASLSEEATRPLRKPLLILLGAVAVLLLVACSNVANLLLSRAAARGNEFAIRASLGASAWRLTRHLITEYFVYAVAGAALGVLLASEVLHVFQTLYPEALQRVENAGVNSWVVLFCLALATVLAVAFAMLTPQRPSRQIRKYLIALELAVACILLSGAGLLTRGFLRLLALDPGFRPDRVVTTQIDLPPARYPSGGKMVAFFDQVLRDLRAQPEIEAAGLVTILPLGGLDRDGPGFTIAGRSETISPSVTMPLVSTGYFEAMGISLQRGRYFNGADTASSPGVAILSETSARRYFPQQDALGQELLALGGRLRFGIVGVVRDVRHWGLDIQPQPMIYVPYLQVPSQVQAVLIRPMTLVVRGDHAGAALIRAAIRSADPEQPVSAVRPMTEVLARSLAQRRLLVSLIGWFAVLTFVLSITGVYAVVSFWVQQRRREAGIRSALGASPQQLRNLIFWEGMRPAFAGLAAGITAAIAAGFAVTDPLAAASAAILLAAAAGLACVIPARRAARINSMEILRDL